MGVLGGGPVSITTGGYQGTDAVVVVGPVVADDQKGRYISNGGSGDPNTFTDYQVENSVHRDPHVWMMGVTSPNGFNGDTVAFVKSAADTELLISRWTAARINDKPDIPNHQPADGSGLVFLYEVMGTYMETVMPDGVTPLWRISGTYYYGKRSPGKNANNDLVFPRPPWLSDLDERTVPDSLLKQNIINVQGSSLAGGPVQRMT